LRKELENAHPHPADLSVHMSTQKSKGEKEQLDIGIQGSGSAVSSYRVGYV
jgi:hypothetical protein